VALRPHLAMGLPFSQQTPMRLQRDHCYESGGLAQVLDGKFDGIFLKFFQQALRELRTGEVHAQSP
jgi:hypothetical protein